MKKRRLIPPSEAERADEEEPDKKARGGADIVHRCGLPLYVLRETLECAFRSRCVSCAHKIAFGTELPTGSKPNVRPELCPRAKLGAASSSFIGLYPEQCRILTVGDGDLSFSLSLVRRLGPSSVTATTFESRESIIRSYPETGLRNLKELQKLGCTPQHGVDAMDLESTLDRDADTDPPFDFIVFNFPCIATDIEGEDGQNQAMLENQTLLQLFGQGASRLLRPGTGQVHVAHKTKAAFKHWDVPGFVVKQAEEGLKPLYATVFDRCAYPGYINRKARDRKSFPATDAVVFVFGFVATPFDPVRDGFQAGEETIEAYAERTRPLHVLPCTDALLNEVTRTVLL